MIYSFRDHRFGDAIFSLGTLSTLTANADANSNEKCDLKGATKLFFTLGTYNLYQFYYSTTFNVIEANDHSLA